MNNYLFRGKRKDNGEWVEGYFGEINVATYILTVAYILTEHKTVPYTKPKRFAVIPETVGMWSGLVDDSPRYRKVFVGDIFQEGDCVGVVKLGRYEMDGATHIGFYVEWSDKARRKDLIYWLERGVEVIGNVHDNASLLEVQK